MDEYTLKSENMISGTKALAIKLSKINSYTEEQSYLLVKSIYKDFLSNINAASEFDEIKLNPKFVIALIQVCLEIELTLEERVNCNSMIYKQLSITTKNKYLEKLYTFLGIIVNRTMTDKLMQCGLSQVLASYLAVVRKSSFNQKDNINRLNFAITCLEPELMTVQRITDIYAMLCNTVDDIELLFTTTMLDTYVFKATDSWITNKILMTAKNMNSSLLSLLESLNPHAIESIFMEYNQIIENGGYTQNDVRFSLASVDNNIFPNIYYMVNYLYSKNIYLP